MAFSHIYPRLACFTMGDFISPPIPFLKHQPRIHDIKKYLIKFDNIIPNNCTHTESSYS